MKKKIVSMIIIVCGVGFSGYGIIGIYEYGFYISARGNPGQLSGGLAPLFVLIGCLVIIYGFIELKLSNQSHYNKNGSGKFPKNSDGRYDE
jgi:hypothetical protein